MMRRLRILSSLVTVAAWVVLLSGCNKEAGDSYGAAPTSPAPSAPNVVAIGGSSFNPPSITVAANATVTWKNNDNISHTATSDAGSWDTGTIAPGGSKTVTFATAGTFAYHCRVHPSMTGSVMVR